MLAVIATSNLTAQNSHYKTYRDNEVKNVKSDIQTDKSVINTDNGLQHNKNADLQELKNNSGTSRAISTFPWTDNFSNMEADNLTPLDWSLVPVAGSTNCFKPTTSITYSAPNAMFHDVAYTSSNSWMITPQLQLPSNEVYELKFWTRFGNTSLSGTSRIYVSTGSNDPSDFTAIRTFAKSEVEAIGTTYTEITVPLQGYSGQQIYIAFNFTGGNMTYQWYIDDVSVTKMPENDLAAISISGNAAAPAGKPSSYKVDVKNFGSDTQTTYNVLLKQEDGSIIQTLSGESIASGETKQFIFSWTPSAEGTFNIYGEVELTGDENTNNDKTSNHSVLVYNPNFTYPYSMGFENEEIWQSWSIVSYGRGWGRVNRTAHGGTYSMANPVSANMTSANDWLFSPAFSLTGTKMYQISFWARANNAGWRECLEVHIATGLTPADVITTQPIWVNNNLTHTDYIKYEINITGYTGEFNFAFRAFSPAGNGGLFLDDFQIEELVVVSGTVTDGTNPVENAKIQVTDNSLIVYTDNSGNYTYGITQLGEHEFNAIKIGYIDDIKTVNVIEEEQIINFTLIPISTYIVSGKVTGNDTDGVGIEGVHITISGYSEYQTDTDVNGNYSIPGVYGDSNKEITYTIKATKAKYMEFTDEVTVKGTDVTYGIELSEMLNKVSKVSVTKVDAYNVDAVITWTAPNAGKGLDRSFTGYNLYRLLQGDPETEWTTLQTNTTSLTYTDLNVWDTLPIGIYQYAVKAVYTSGTSEAVMSNNMDIEIENIDEPFALEVEEIDVCEHKFSWNNIYTANVTMTAYDVYPGYNVGFQMWLDDTATLYNTSTLPASNNYIGSCSTLDPTFFDSFSHSIPENAILSCDTELTSNWVKNNSVTIQIPQGIYDLGIYYLYSTATFSTFYLSSTNGTCSQGILNDYEFLPGKKYTFTSDPAGSWGTGFCLTVEDDEKFGYRMANNSKSFKGFNVFINGIFVEMTTNTEYTFTNLPAGTHTAGVQTVFTTGVSEIFEIEIISTCTTLSPAITISATSNDNLYGSVTGSNVYNKYDLVTLTATPEEGCEFVNWTEEGVVVSTSNLFEFAAISNRTLVGNFLKIPVYTITATSNNEAWGEVTGGDDYLQGTEVTLVATPKTDYKFVNWTEEDEVVTTENPYEFTAISNRTLVGNFVIIPIYTITATSNNDAWGEVTGGNDYLEGAEVNLVATPKAGYKFIKWTEDGIEISTNNTLVFLAEANRTLVGNFEKIPVYYTINATSNNNSWGEVTGGNTYLEGDQVTLIASPKTGYQFEKWTENGTEIATTTTLEFPAAANRTIVGNFKKITFTITATPNNDAWGAVTGGTVYDYNEQVYLTATPKSGYRFVNWTEEDVEVATENVYKFPALSNRTLIGNFVPIEYTVTFVIKDKETQVAINGATITFNGVTQTGNYIFLNVPTGDKSYLIKADGYNDKTGSVTVNGNKTETVELEPKVGIILDNHLSGIVLYPNPFDNEININNSALVKNVQIINATGQTIKNVIFDGKTISTKELANGIYFITIENITGDKTVYKMVKK